MSLSIPVALKVPRTFIHDERILHTFVNVALRAHAKNITLSFSAKKNTFSLTAPIRIRKKMIHDMIAQKHDWMIQILEQYARSTDCFVPNTMICFLGERIRLEYSQCMKVSVVYHAGILHVHGPEERFHASVELWFRQQAHQMMAEITLRHATSLNVSINRVSVRTAFSRWGSCSSSGNINYNWRLIHAPRFVIDYVCAHEVSHRIYMNHSTAFWDTVKQIMPEYVVARLWLKENGHILHAYSHDYDL